MVYIIVNFLITHFDFFIQVLATIKFETLAYI